MKKQYTEMETFLHALRAEISFKFKDKQIPVIMQPAMQQENERSAFTFIVGQQRFTTYQTHSGEYYWERH